jgi:hypothetical protein
MSEKKFVDCWSFLPEGEDKANYEVACLDCLYAQAYGRCPYEAENKPLDPNAHNR